MKKLCLILCCCVAVHAKAQRISLANPDSYRDTSIRTALQPRKELSIQPDFYAQHCAFFCKQEIKMEKVHVPFIFRLGSVEYNNWLEQKPNSYKP